jgi:hypothetical protein
MYAMHRTTPRGVRASAIKTRIEARTGTQIATVEAFVVAG